VLATGATSGRLQPGESRVLDGGVVAHDMEGWCSIVGHRAMGMTLSIVATGAAAGTAADGGAVAAGSGAAELARVGADMMGAAGPDVAVRDARLPAATGPQRRVTLEAVEVAAEIA